MSSVQAACGVRHIHCMDTLYQTYAIALAAGAAQVKNLLEIPEDQGNAPVAGGDLNLKRSESLSCP